jgi:ABC-2 type transport system permease protein
LVLVARFAFGWGPGPGWSPILFVIAILLGTLAFAGLGLLLAGTLRAEAVLALANGLFLLFLLLGGIILPIDHLPDALQPIAAVLPATALADLLRVALNTGAGAGASATAALVILGIWALAAAGLAALRFRWD